MHFVIVAQSGLCDVCLLTPFHNANTIFFVITGGNSWKCGYSSTEPASTNREYSDSTWGSNIIIIIIRIIINTSQELETATVIIVSLLYTWFLS